MFPTAPHVEFRCEVCSNRALYLPQVPRNPQGTTRAPQQITRSVTETSQRDPGDSTQVIEPSALPTSPEEGEGSEDHAADDG